MNEESEYVKVKVIATHFGVTAAAIYKWVDQGRILARRLGRRILVSRAEFDYIKASGLRAGTDQKKLRLALAW